MRSAQLRSSPPADCRAATPPACGANQFEQILELLGGMPDAAANAPDQARCQVAAYRGATRFLERRFRERQAGLRRQRRSDRAVRRLRRTCTLRIEQTDAGPLPRFGGRCAALQNRPAHFLSGDHVQRCLRPALEEIINDLSSSRRFDPTSSWW